METASKYGQGDYFYAEPYIHTRSGRFYLNKPRFDTGDISHSLGMLCRFNGHTERFYSVAEHCLMVACLMKYAVGGDPREGLLHDACEAYLSDIPTPFKRLLPDVERFDAPLERAMREAFGLPVEPTAQCKEADKLALFIEAHHLIPEGGADFVDTNGVRPKALELVKTGLYEPRCLAPAVASLRWLEMYARQTN